LKMCPRIAVGLKKGASKSKRPRGNDTCPMGGGGGGAPGIEPVAMI
jgi:uncharacterized spore protein YtfJ